MLSLRNISKSFGDKTILNDFSYDFKESGLVLIKGPSGCGKTTLLRLIAGLEKLDSGEILKNGVISLLFQEDRLLPWLSAIENVTCVASKKSTENKRKAQELLSLVGLEGEENERIENLSGGMKRRVAFARALLPSPNILLLDEPFNGLDSDTKKRLIDLTLSYSQEHLVIMVTHDSDDIKLAQEVISF